jgi:hypothetical protein
MRRGYRLPLKAPYITNKYDLTKDGPRLLSRGRIADARSWSWKNSGRALDVLILANPMG